jgi:hypothetical protein
MSLVDSKIDGFEQGSLARTITAGNHRGITRQTERKGFVRPDILNVQFNYLCHRKMTDSN